VNPEVHAHAAALAVALVKAGELETAYEFVEWALEHLDYDLQEILDDA
jgi:hypothetical protein